VSHLAGASPLLRISHDMFTYPVNQIFQTSCGEWGAFRQPGRGTRSDRWRQNSRQTAIVETLRPYRQDPSPVDVIHATPFEGVWLIPSGEHGNNFSKTYAQQPGLLHQIMRDLAFEIAEDFDAILRDAPPDLRLLLWAAASAGCQPADYGVTPVTPKECISEGIVHARQFMVISDVPLWSGIDHPSYEWTGRTPRNKPTDLRPYPFVEMESDFPDAFDEPRAVDLVERALKVIQKVRPGWKRQVLMPGNESSPFSGNHASSSADLPEEAKTPWEPPTENVDIETPGNSSTDSTVTRIPVGELFSDSGEISFNEAAPRRSAPDIHRADSGTLEVNMDRSREERHNDSARMIRTGAVVRLFECPNLCRFVPVRSKKSAEP